MNRPPCAAERALRSARNAGASVVKPSSGDWNRRSASASTAPGSGSTPGDRPRVDLVARDPCAWPCARARSCRRTPAGSRRPPARPRRPGRRRGCARPRAARRAPARPPPELPACARKSLLDSSAIGRRYRRACASAPVFSRRCDCSSQGPASPRSRSARRRRAPSSPPADGTGPTRSAARSRTWASAPPTPSPTPTRSAWSSTSAART